MPENDQVRVKALFDAAVELDSLRRDAWLECECAGDAGLLAELRELLEIDAKLDGLTVQPIARGLTSLIAASAPDASLTGLRVGPYALREELGRGGMGLVYRAERVDGDVEQQVAIKFVRRELLDAETRRRFLIERQMLAALDHPNIARLYDAAELEDGSPYYVMEFVAGIPIDAYCDRARLPVRERVALFRTVCGAVAEAHRNLIVHRDLKPGNLLVSAAGVPKLLDFGIAKPLALADDSASLEHTGTAQRYFSPLYAAPEQLLGGPIGVACDVYALGLLLYEILAGTRPFDLTGLSAGQVERLISTVPPVAPSAAAARSGAPALLPRQLRGDLDGIVLRCLRKAPGERYASVEQLEADLGNFLEGRAVLARGGHGWYQLRKFIGRHRLSVAIVTIAALALASAAVLLLTQNLALTRERDRAQHALDFLKSAFIAADPAQVAGADVTARQILAAQRPKLEELFDAQPELYASMAATIVEVQMAMGMPTEAADLSGRAVAAARRARLGATTLQHLLTLHGHALSLGSHLPEAEQELTAAAELGIAATPELRVAQGRLLSAQGATEPAIALLKALVAELDGRAPSDELATSARWQLAEAYRSGARYAEALASLDATLHWQSQALPAGHPRIVRTRQRRIELLRRQGKLDEALLEARTAVAEVERYYGSDTALAADARNSLGSALYAKEQYADAVAEYRLALQAWRRSLGSEHPSTIRTAYNLASALTMIPGQLDEAERSYRNVVAASTRRFGAQSQMVVFFRLNWAEFLLTHERADEAIEAFADAQGIAGLRTAVGQNRTDYVRLMGEAYAASCKPKAIATPAHVGACLRAALWIKELPD